MRARREPCRLQCPRTDSTDTREAVPKLAQIALHEAARPDAGGERVAHRAGRFPFALAGLGGLSDSARELARERARRLAGETSWLLKEPARLADAELGDARFAALEPEAKRAVLSHLLERHPEVAAAGLLDERGRPLPGLWASRPHLEPAALPGHAGLAVALGKSGRMSLAGSPRLVPGAAARLAPLVIVLGAGDPARFAVLELSLEPLDALLQRSVAAPAGAFVVDRSGRLVAGNGPAQAPGQTNLTGTPAVALALGAPAARAGAFDSPAGRMLAAWAEVPGTEWTLIVHEPGATAFASVGRLRRLLAVGIGIALLLAAGLSFLFARGVLRPLHALSGKALEIAGGSFGVQAEVRGKGEIARLAEVFNYMSQQLLAYDGETRRLYQGLEEGYMQTMLALASVIDSKDSYTLGHSQRVGEWAAEIGKEMGLPEMQVRHLLYGGILHDVGKIGVVEPILCKRSRLTDEEMDAMKGHPVIGASIIAGVGFLKPVLPAVRHHHERWDGSGYPDGLKGEEIPLIARIVGAADIWDAITSIRPYQKAMPAEQALEVMLKFKGSQLAPEVVDALERVVRTRQSKGELVSAGDGGAGSLPRASQAGA